MEHTAHKHTPVMHKGISMVRCEDTQQLTVVTMHTVTRVAKGQNICPRCAEQRHLEDMMMRLNYLEEAEERKVRTARKIS